MGFWYEKIFREAFFFFFFFADSFAFSGTIVQRVMAKLGVRMHYGHPDFFSSAWVFSRSALSKANPTYNLSEDIFAGSANQKKKKKKKNKKNKKSKKQKTKKN